MAIDLPPGAPPALMTVQEHELTQAQAGNVEPPVIRTRTMGHEVLVQGNTQLDPARVSAALLKGKTLSEAVWHLHYAYQQAGHRLTRLRYFLKADRLHIRVIEGYIQSVEAPQDIQRYFWEVEGKTYDLPRMEARRLLANMHAERTGQTLQNRFEPLNPTSPAYAFHVESTKNPEHSPFEVNAELGNPGNRFVGRHFLEIDAGYQHGNSQWKLWSNHSLPELDDGTPRSGSLSAYELSTNSLIPIGMLAFGIGESSYEYALSDTERYDGEVQQAQLLMQHIAYADLRQRLLISERLVFIDNETQQVGVDENVIDERYFALQIDLEYITRLEQNTFQPRFKTTLGVTKGLSDNQGTLGEQRGLFLRDAGFLILRPALEMDLLLFDQWILNTRLQSQFADRQVPEQQQWVLGGDERLSAWLAGAFVGDEGHYLQLTLKPIRNRQLGRLSLEPAVFVEAGSSHFHDRPLKGQQGADGGISLRMKLPADWEIKLIAAEPLHAENDELLLGDDSESDFYFSIRKRW